jgi:DNA ligase-1
MASFPLLFGSSAAGKTKSWSVCVVERDGFGVIQTTHGYVGTKQTTTERILTVGKNIGKKNETTPLEQARKEAQSDWTRKIEREGYEASPGTLLSPTTTAATETTETAATTETTETATGATAATAAGGDAGKAIVIPRPMLAHSKDKRGKDIRYPCYVQQKLDGVRCLAISGQGLYSRKAKAFPHLDHIRAEVNALPAGTVLDGELYSDTLGFQEIVGIVRKAKLGPADAARVAQIHLCVYDTITTDTNEVRKASLEALFASKTFTALRLLPSDECKGEEDVKRFHDAYVAEGYEGLILRNKAGLYSVGQRSKDLQKYKEFLDEEFEVSGFTVGTGVEAGCVLWTCKTTEGKEFSCRPKGTHESRQDAVATAAAQIGKKLTVRFQEWTDDKKPRFPVGVAFRDYE